MIASGAVAMAAAPTTTAAAAPNKSGTSPRCRQAADADESGAATRAATTRPLINVLVGCTSVLLSQTEAPPAHLTPSSNESPGFAGREIDRATLILKHSACVL